MYPQNVVLPPDSVRGGFRKSETAGYILQPASKNPRGFPPGAEVNLRGIRQGFERITIIGGAACYIKRAEVPYGD